MANGSSTCCLLVLAVAHAAAAAAAATTGAPAPEAPARARRLLPLGSSLPPATAEAGAAAAACVQSVLEASGPCARDVLETLVFKTARLSTDCCRVLAGVGEECVAAVFSGASVGPPLLPVVNRVCGLVALASNG
ncbi:hypothetical protein SETIT_6G196600v2 [Setaria italica]|uniref:Prolamin-like domain-containing protein n=1 Tax=Setaria italica TaxID=4555 RepID=A0A368RN80_SETIT|nr:hypothetical protein SETIT_6G196600v2 [Setaria italica]